MKYFGKIGFMTMTDDGYGVISEKIVERPYRGEVSKIYVQNSVTGSPNSDLDVRHQISIVADAYANENISGIRYIEWLQSKWRVTAVELEPPRMNLTIGGVYNA